MAEAPRSEPSASYGPFQQEVYGDSASRPAPTASARAAPGDRSMAEMEVAQDNFIRATSIFALALDELSEAQWRFHHLSLVPYSVELKKYLQVERELLAASYSNLQAVERYLSFSVPFRNKETAFTWSFHRYRAALLNFHKAEWEYHKAQHEYASASAVLYALVPPGPLY